MRTRPSSPCSRRDAHVARRNFIPLLLQTLLQPMLLVFVFGRVHDDERHSCRVQYKSLLLPGIIALSMVLSGIQAVAMPLISEFQFTKEIEDRLLAPIEIEWVAIEKILGGMIQALVAGLVVLPAAWLRHGPGRGPLAPPSRRCSSRLRARRDPLLGDRADARLLGRSDADRPDVLAGARADDLLRLHLLPVERAPAVSRSSRRPCS